MTGTCAVCQQQECGLNALDAWQLCHDIARAKGGQVSLKNIAPGKYDCNLHQKTMSFDEFVASFDDMHISNRPRISKINSAQFQHIFPKARKELLDQMLF